MFFALVFVVWSPSFAEETAVLITPVRESSPLTETYSAELLKLGSFEDRDAYCNLVKTTSLSRHRPERGQMRHARAAGYLRSFSHNHLHGMTIDDWRRLLGERFHLKCDAQEYFPRARDQRLRGFPELSCHTICRACFHESLPICLRRNMDNNFGITCYCTYDDSSPVDNHVFRITD